MHKCISHIRPSSEWKPLRLDWRGSSTEKRSHFRGAKSFASSPQLVRTGWKPVLDLAPTFKWSKCVSCLKHARRAKTMANCFIVHRARHAKRFDQRSVRISDRSVVRSEIGAPRVLKEARRCQSVRKLLFLFARAPAKCGRKGPSMHVHWATVFDRRKKFCESGARLDGLVDLR